MVIRTRILRILIVLLITLAFLGIALYFSRGHHTPNRTVDRTVYISSAPSLHQHDVVPSRAADASRSSANSSQSDVTPTRAAIPLTVEAATNDFGFRLYAKLANSDGEQNLFISPLSLELALAMTYNGARGSTRQAMAKTLGWEGTESGTSKRWLSHPCQKIV